MRVGLTVLIDFASKSGVNRVQTNLSSVRARRGSGGRVESDMSSASRQEGGTWRDAGFAA